MLDLLSILSIWIVMTLTGVILVFGLYNLQNSRRFYQLGNKVPGPVALPLLGNAFEFIGCSPNDMLPKISLLSHTYGSPMRFWLGPDLNIIISDPENTKIVLLSSKALKKGPTYKFMQPYLGQGLLAGSGHVWKKQRKAVNPAFNSKNLDEHFASFKTHCDLLLDKLEQLADGQVFNIFEPIALCTFDIVLETLLGVPGEKQNTNNTKVIHSLERGYTISYTRMTQWLYQYDALFYFTEMRKQHRHVLGDIDKFTTNILNKKKEFSCNSYTVLDTILNDAKISTQDAKNAVFTLFTASQESTATICSFVILMLGIHHDIQRKVHEEIDEVFQVDTETDITAKDLNALKYLDMCVKETLRLYPIGSVLQRQLTEDIQLSNNLQLPKGCSVAILIYVMHRNGKFWVNGDNFTPERFTPEEIQKRHPYTYIPFSVGPMNCIGQRYAELVVKYLTISILRKYKIESAYKNIEEVKLKTDISIRPRDGYLVSLQKRY